MDWEDAITQYNPETLQPGFNGDTYFIPNPALGLWKA